jgi:hypothetical protein
MKFTVTVNVTTKKTGLDLLESYERLGFEKTPNVFPSKRITFQVSLEFVKANKEAFFGSSYAAFIVDLDKTEKDDWEDWGSAGSMLSAKNVNEIRLTNWLS